MERYKYKDYTGLLYANPSLLSGAARVLDLGGTFDDYNASDSAEEADSAAMASDWYATGADLCRAIRRYRRRRAKGNRNVPGV